MKVPTDQILDRGAKWWELLEKAEKWELEGIWRWELEGTEKWEQQGLGGGR